MVDAQDNRRRVGPRYLLAPRVEKWFMTAARDLPWRRTRTPYGTLVSEAMLQQTQVARVCEAWRGFLAHFPTIFSLAAASDDKVLKAWQGLGYYRRARHLHAAARVIVASHGGEIPDNRAQLEELPGIGPYCAGAIASIAFGQREAIVDGNVARVMMRIHGKNVDALSHGGKAWLWNRAREYVRDARDCALANEGLMELGATICTVLSPKCERCPVENLCAARAAGTQDRIPRPRRRASRTVLHAQVILATVGGRSALVRRAHSGLWADMMFPPMIETARVISAAVIAKRLAVPLTALIARGRFEFLTTHRTVRFGVWRLDDVAAKGLKRRGIEGFPAAFGAQVTWHRAHEVKKLSVTSAMAKILACDTPHGKGSGKRVVLVKR